jgi:GNAT superfamily N-acetyltransferase
MSTRSEQMALSIPYEPHSYRGEEVAAFDRWEELQALMFESVLHDTAETGTNRTEAEVAEFVSLDDPERFKQSRISPQSEVGGDAWPEDGKRFRPNQEFYHPRLVVTTLRDKITGFATGASNVSGATPEIRDKKRTSVLQLRNHLYVRDFYVAPGYRRHGLAPAIGLLLLQDVSGRRPVSTWAFPRDFGHTANVLLHYGFEMPDSEENLQSVFGREAEPSNMVRFVTRAYKLRRRLNKANSY